MNNKMIRSTVVIVLLLDLLMFILFDFIEPKYATPYIIGIVGLDSLTSILTKEWRIMKLSTLVVKIKKRWRARNSSPFLS